MRTLLIDTDRLGPVMLRETPRRMERDEVPVVTADGEAIYMSRLILPGGARNTYAETPTPAQVRLKLLGSDRGLHPSLVRLGGKVTVTRWYQRGARGQASKSELTVSAERIDPANGASASITGWLPVNFQIPTAELPLLLGDVPLEGGGWRAFLSLPEGTVEGVAEVDSQVPVGHLIGQHVRPVLWAKLVQPDAEDLSRNVKSELPLFATVWEPAEGKPARTVRDAKVEAQPEGVSG